jgi:Zn-dependent M28 family amino/carboxypeptidase
LLAGLTVLLLAAGLQAQPAADAGDFSAAAFRSHVAFVADDLLEGRDTGSRGHEIAARYVASEFEGLGLHPGNGDSWYQRIAFLRVAGDPNATMTVGGRTFAQGHDIILRATADGAADVSAPLVFAGYGLDMPAHGFDDYHGLDVRGKIVVVLGGTPAGIPSDVAAHLNGDKRRMAAARGAVGLLTIRSRADSIAIPWQRVVRFADRPTTTWTEPGGAPFADAPGLRFAGTVDDSAAAALFEASGHTLDSVLDAAAVPNARPAGFALRQTAHLSGGAGQAARFTSPNVLAILPGSDPAAAGEYVLLMAHLDHLGIREPRPGDAPDADRINNGAMDNASGIATLIEVARELSRPGNRPRRPILFAAVTGEERGELGSQYLSLHPVTGSGRIVGVVNLDMPILTYDFTDVTAFGAEHSTLGPIVARAAARMGVTLSPDPLPQEGLFTRSDHYKFVLQGVPSVFLMTGFANGGGARFRAFLDTRYHSPRDDMSQDFNWHAGARFAQLNYLIAREIADAPEPPRWYRGSFFGDAFGGDQRRATRE